MKILINEKYSGLRLSYKALCRYNELTGTEYVVFSYIENIGSHITQYEFCAKPFVDCIEVVLQNPNDCDAWMTHDLNEISRDDPALVQTYEELEYEFSDEPLYQKCAVIDIPDNTSWDIVSQDWGRETLVTTTVTINRSAIPKGITIDKLCDLIESDRSLITFETKHY